MFALWGRAERGQRREWRKGWGIAEGRWWLFCFVGWFEVGGVVVLGGFECWD